MICNNKQFEAAQKKNGKIVMYDATMLQDNVGILLSPCKRCNSNHIFSVGEENRTDIPIRQNNRWYDEKYFIAEWP